MKQDELTASDSRLIHDNTRRIESLEENVNKLINTYSDIGVMSNNIEWIRKEITEFNLKFATKEEIKPIQSLFSNVSKVAITAIFGGILGLILK